MGMWMSEKVTRNKAVCRGGHGPAYRHKGFVFIQGFDFYPEVNESLGVESGTIHFVSLKSLK